MTKGSSGPEYIPSKEERRLNREKARGASPGSEGLSPTTGGEAGAGELLSHPEDPALASPHANKLKTITAAEAPDDTTFKLTFSAPFAPFVPFAPCPSPSMFTSSPSGADDPDPAAGVGSSMYP